MTWIEAVILGVVQGLTEFLPVSSSGHLEIGTVLLGIKTNENLLFAVIVHAATALSTIVVYREDLREIVMGLFDFKYNESLSFSLKIVLSMIPVGIVGVFFERDIEAFFGGKLVLVGSMLLVTSALLFFTHFAKENAGKVTYGKALIIGLAQAIAILPGISRSGSTIATALFLGVEKSKATRFSFLMVLIPILGASFLKFIDYIESPQTHEGLSAFPLILGFLAAFISGYFACKWMIGIVRKGKLTWFAVYCFVIGSIALISQIWI
ncbi:MAG: undecaprenyl-diphosphatase [Cyclobacteriaceae bacterium]|jgi:undecaprenyl-diphosphatase